MKNIRILYRGNLEKVDKTIEVNDQNAKYNLIDKIEFKTPIFLSYVRNNFQNGTHYIITNIYK